MAKVPMPTVGTYRGVALHAFQSRERIERVVCPEIDQVMTLAAPRRLAAIACDITKSPEARMAAADKVLERAAAATDRHRGVAGVDIVKVKASRAGLNTLNLADPARYGTLLQPEPPPLQGGARAPRRPAEHAEALRAAWAKMHDAQG